MSGRADERRTLDDPWWRAHPVDELDTVDAVHGITDGISWRAWFGAGPIDRQRTLGWTRVVKLTLDPVTIGEHPGGLLSAWDAIGRDVRRELENFERTRRTVTAILRTYPPESLGELRQLSKLDRPAAVAAAAKVYQLALEHDRAQRPRTSVWVADALGLSLSAANELIRLARERGLIPPVAPATATTTITKRSTKRGQR